MNKQNIRINKIPLRPADFRSRERKPLYLRLQEKLQLLIETGHWKPNERIPTERDIVEATGISINTVKKTLENLERGGYLHRRQGMGTFVTSPETFFGLHRYYGMQKDFGRELERHRKVLLSLTRFAPPDEVRRYLELGDNDEVFRLERLLYVRDRKTIHTFSWLPEAMFSGLDTLEPEAFEKRPLYELLAVEFNSPCRVSRELLSVDVADETTAAKLEIGPGTPLLRSVLIAYGYRDKPFEVRESRVLTDELRLYREF